MERFGAQDAALLFHVNSYAILEMITPSTPPEFWHKFVLPLSQDSECVRQSLCALGAAHQLFLVQNRQDQHVIFVSGDHFRIAAIEAYSKAIKKLRKHLSSGPEADPIIVIICSLIFVCIENLQCRYSEAMRHFKSACKLMKSLLCLTAGKHQRTSDYLVASSDRETLNQIMTDILSQLGFMYMLYSGQAASDLDFGLSITDPGDPHTPFSNVQDAEMQMRHAMKKFVSFFLHLLAKPQPDENANVDTLPADPKVRAASTSPAYLAFNTWVRRFDLFLQDREGFFSMRELHDLQPLRVQFAWWQALMREDGGICTVDCKNVLEQVRHCLQYESLRSAPRFSIGGDFINILFYTCVSSNDIQVRRDCAELLSKLNRREAMWDSQQLAQVCEALAKQLENNSTATNLPFGVVALGQLLEVPVHNLD